MKLSEYTFNNLIEPFTLTDFEKKYYEQKILHNKKGHDFFSNLLTGNDIDRVINTRSIKYPTVNIIGGSNKVLPSQYTDEFNKIVPDKVFKYYADGYTIALSGLHENLLNLTLLCESMRRVFHHRFQTNVYCTPKNSQGFDIHYDSHDVFILQIQGRKNWCIYNSPINLPLKGIEDFEKERLYDSKLECEIELTPGDILYIPRGVMHKAFTSNTSSIHITLGLVGYTYLDLAIEILKEASLSEETLKKYLPIGFLNGKKEVKEIEEKMNVAFKGLDKIKDIYSSILNFKQKLIKDLHPVLINQLLIADSLQEISLKNVFAVRDNVLFDYSVVGGNVVLSFHGQEHGFPIHCKDILDYIFEKRKFKGIEIPDVLDESGKLNILSFLSKEGLLMVSTDEVDTKIGLSSDTIIERHSLNGASR